MSLARLLDRDRDGNRIDDIAGVVGGAGNVGRGLFGGLDVPGRTVGDRLWNAPGHIADTYRSGARAGNQAGDDVAAWWDSL